MGDDRPVSLAVLRSVIDSYHKKREALEKREAEVKERLQAMRARSPRKAESYEINIETRESIVRSTSEVTPTGSYLPSQQGNCGSESGELLFHSEYSQYRNSEQSVHQLKSDEISDEVVPSPKEKSSRKSRFSYKNYDKRFDQKCDSDSEGSNGKSVPKRKRTQKKTMASPRAEPRESRDTKKFERYSMQTKEQMVNVSESDRSISQIDISREQTFTVRESRSPSPLGHKERTDRKMEYAAEKLARVGVKVADERMKGPIKEEREDNRYPYGRHNKEVAHSTQSSRRHKSSREPSNKELEQMKEVLSEYRAPYSQQAQVSDRVTKKSLKLKKDSRPRPRTGADVAVNRHSRPVKKRSASDSEVSHHTVTDSSRSLVEERYVKSSLPRPAAKALVYNATDGSTHTQRLQGRIGETQSMLSRPPTPVTPEGYTRTRSPRRRVEETRSMLSKPRTSVTTEGYTHTHQSLPRKIEETRSMLSRPSTPVTTEGYTHTYQSLPRKFEETRTMVSKPRTPITPDGYTHSHLMQGRAEETQSMVSRPRTPITPDRYTHSHLMEGRIEETQSMVTRPSTPVKHCDVRPRSQPSPDRTVTRRSPTSGFDEVYSNNFLIFLIRKSLPRAMTSILLPMNGFKDKTVREVLNYVEEIDTIKKLICDELDRRDWLGKPFKILRKEKELMMKNFLYAKIVSDRLRQGLPVQEAITNLHDHNSESAVRLQERTVLALRQAKHLLGGDLPDPEEADDLEEAARECLNKLNGLNVPTSPHNENRLQVVNQQDWVTDEVNRLKDALTNIEKHLPGRGYPRRAEVERGLTSYQRSFTSYEQDNTASDDTIRVGGLSMVRTPPAAPISSHDYPQRRNNSKSYRQR